MGDDFYDMRHPGIVKWYEKQIYYKFSDWAQSKT